MDPSRLSSEPSGEDPSLTSTQIDQLYSKFKTSDGKPKKTSLPKTKVTTTFGKPRIVPELSRQPSKRRSSPTIEVYTSKQAPPENRELLKKEKKEELMKRVREKQEEVSNRGTAASAKERSKSRESKAGVALGKEVASAMKLMTKVMGQAFN